MTTPKTFVSWNNYHFIASHGIVSKSNVFATLNFCPTLHGLKVDFLTISITFTVLTPPLDFTTSTLAIPGIFESSRGKYFINIKHRIYSIYL